MSRLVCCRLNGRTSPILLTRTLRPWLPGWDTREVTQGSSYPPATVHVRAGRSYGVSDRTSRGVCVARPAARAFASTGIWTPSSGLRTITTTSISSYSRIVSNSSTLRGSSLLQTASGIRDSPVLSSVVVEERVKAETLSMSDIWNWTKEHFALETVPNQISAANKGQVTAASEDLKLVPSGSIVYCFAARHSPSEDWTPVYFGRSSAGRERLTNYTRDGNYLTDKDDSKKRLAVLECIMKGLEIEIWYMKVPKGTEINIESSVLDRYDFAFNSQNNGCIRPNPLCIDQLPDITTDQLLKQEVDKLRKVLYGDHDSNTQHSVLARQLGQMRVSELRGALQMMDHMMYLSCQAAKLNKGALVKLMVERMSTTLESTPITASVMALDSLSNQWDRDTLQHTSRNVLMLYCSQHGLYKTSELGIKQLRAKVLEHYNNQFAQHSSAASFQTPQVEGATQPVPESLSATSNSSSSSNSSLTDDGDSSISTAPERRRRRKNGAKTDTRLGHESGQVCLYQSAAVPAVAAATVAESAAVKDRDSPSVSTARRRRRTKVDSNIAAPASATVAVAGEPVNGKAHHRHTQTCAAGPAGPATVSTCSDSATEYRLAPTAVVAAASVAEIAESASHGTTVGYSSGKSRRRIKHNVTAAAAPGAAAAVDKGAEKGIPSRRRRRAPKAAALAS